MIRLRRREQLVGAAPMMGAKSTVIQRKSAPGKCRVEAPETGLQPLGERPRSADGCVDRYSGGRPVDADGARSAISWPLRPNFAKSKSMRVGQRIAIGSSMTALGMAGLMRAGVERSAMRSRTLR